MIPLRTSSTAGGTGESPIRGNVSPGDGMYRSTDAGKTWVASGLQSLIGLAAIAYATWLLRSAQGLDGGNRARNTRAAREFARRRESRRPLLEPIPFSHAIDVIIVFLF